MLFLVSLLFVVSFQSERPLAARTITFSGLVWDVRAGSGNPGNQCWTDSPARVWVDSSDQLHLKLQPIGGRWCSVQVTAQTNARYGTHEFRVISRLDSLDPDLVLGMYLYKDDSNEIDIEITDSFSPSSYRGWYAVQPSTAASRTSFPITMAGTYSTHSFDWQTSDIRFASWHGHCAEPCGGLVHSWTYNGLNNPNESLNLRPNINLWINGSNPATAQEVIIASYSGSLEPDTLEQH